MAIKAKPPMSAKQAAKAAGATSGAGTGGGGGGGGGWGGSSVPTPSTPTKYLQKAQQTRAPAPNGPQLPPGISTTSSPTSPGAGGGAGGGVSGGGGGGYSAPSLGGGGGYSGGPVASNIMGSYGGAVDPNAGMTDDAWLASDSIFGTESSGLNNAYAEAMAALNRRRGEYDVDYKSALRSLGWQGEDASGQWNPNDMLGAYGQGLNNIQNDFAARGMMGSSFYARGLQDMVDSFGSQRDQIFADRGAQTTGFNEEEAAAKRDLDNAVLQARMSALARRAAGLQLPSSI